MPELKKTHGIYTPQVMPLIKKGIVHFNMEIAARF